MAKSVTMMNSFGSGQNSPGFVMDTSSMPSAESAAIGTSPPRRVHNSRTREKYSHP